jgi:DNA-directed RNA polymerase subunit L
MQVKEVSNTIDTYDSSCLQIEISGKNVCYQLINSIRKVCINQIPIYAFHHDKIKITHNSSVFDNSFMTCHLSQLPITKFNHNIKFLPAKYYEGVNFLEQKIERYIEDVYEINYSLKKKNNGPENLLNVTTNDLNISITNTNHEEDKLVSNNIIPAKEKYSEKNPILLCQLRMGEEIEFSMKGVIATGELNSIFNASNTYYKEIAPDKFLLSIESSGQLNEYEIIIRACEILIEKFKLIKEKLNTEQLSLIQSQNNSVILEILKEDHTCGGPLNWVLQNMENVLFSGVNKPDFLQKKVHILIQTEKNIKPIDCFNKAIDQTIKIYEEYYNKFTELYKGKKTENKNTENKKTENKKTENKDKKKINKK